MIFQDIIEYVFTQDGMADSIDNFKELEGNLAKMLIHSSRDRFNEIDKILGHLGIYLDIVDSKDVKEIIGREDNSGYYFKNDIIGIVLYCSKRKLPLIQAIFKMYNIDVHNMRLYNV